MKLRVGIVGAGICGAAAAHELARRGAEVLLFDQFPFHHKHGSSHGPSRLFRLAYFEHPSYVPLLYDAVTGWRALEHAAGKKLFVQSGLLEAGHIDGPLVAGTLASANLHDLSIKRLDMHTAQTRYPMIHLTDDMEILFEEEAGFLLADKVMLAYLDLAAGGGVQFHECEEIKGWSVCGGSIRIQSETTNYCVDKLVLTPGPWATNLLGPEVPVGVMEKPLFWFGGGDGNNHSQSPATGFAVERSDQRFFYGFPAMDKNGVKIGEHTGGREIQSPDQRLGHATGDERDDIKNFVATYLPGLPTKITREETCLYEMSPDGHFMIDRHPTCENVCFAAGLSGHGFKFAPVIGQLLADMVMENDPNPNAEFLRLSRFQSN